MLSALATGDLSAFNGLGPEDDRAAAEAAFGPSEPGPDGIGPLMGVLSPFRRYPPAGVGRYGVVVWFEGERVQLVDFPSPGLDANDLLVLGEPELKAPSGLDVFHVQLVWPARGLAAHVSEDDGTVRALYAFAPMDGEGYMAWLGAARGPRRVR